MNINGIVAKHQLVARVSSTGSGSQVSFPVGRGDQMVTNDIRAIKDDDRDGVLVSSDEQKLKVLMAALQDLRAAGVKDAALRLTARAAGGEWRPWPHIWIPAQAAEAQIPADVMTTRLAQLRQLHAEGILTAEALQKAVMNLLLHESVDGAEARDAAALVEETPGEVPI